MQIFLPIADVSVNLFGLLLLGAGVGFLSGMFGIGGGFLVTPALITLFGIPPAVAVSTEANQITASSVSGTIAHWRRQGVDVRMGMLLVAGGAVGSVVGVGIFTALRESGQIDVFVAVAYVFFLTVIGGLMLFESVRAMRRDPDAAAPPRREYADQLMAALPWKMHFPASGLHISILPPLVLGFSIGLLAALMGIGGGFIMIPAMIYILRMPTNVVVGTSLLQILVVTAITTVLQAVQNQTVDLVLAFYLVLGGVVGAQLGARVGARLRAERLRALLALMVLSVGLILLIDLVRTPGEMFELVPIS